MNTLKVKKEPLTCGEDREFLGQLNSCEHLKEHSGTGNDTGEYWFQVNDRHMLGCLAVATVTAGPKGCCCLEARSAFGTLRIGVQFASKHSCFCSCVSNVFCKHTLCTILRTSLPCTIDT